MDEEEQDRLSADSGTPSLIDFSRWNSDRQTPSIAEPYNETCGKCKEILLEPYQTRCGHRLCKTCLSRLFHDHGEPAMCPYKEEDCEYISLNADNGSVYPDFYLLKNIKRLKVYCTFKHLGCQEIMKFEHLKRHELICTYGKVPCRYEDLGCATKVSPSKLSTHESQCPYIPKICQYCNNNIATCHMEEHLQRKCPMVIITCQFKCGMEFLRSKLESHLIECPNKPAKCKFSRMGCNFEGNGEEMDKHYQMNRETHLELVTDRCEHLEKRMKDLEHSQQEATSSTAASIKKTEEVLKTHHLQLSRQGNILKETQKAVARHEETLRDNKVVGSSQGSQEVDALKLQLTETMSRFESLQTAHSRSLSTIQALEEQVRNQATKLTDYDIRFQILETASFNGELLWKIVDYPRRKEDAKRGGVQSLYSQPFYTSTHGYRMCARVYLNGDGMGKNSHLSLFFVIMRGEYDALLQWPFRAKVTLMLLDQTGRKRHVVDTFRPDPSSSSFQRPTTSMNIASGCPKFISHEVLEANNSPYLLEKTIYIKIVVDMSDIQAI